MDLDYKALSNVGTWLMGRLRERDCERDLAAELRDRGLDVNELGDMPQRSFLLLTKRNEHTRFRVRHTLSFLRGPLELNEIARLQPLPPPRRGLLGRLFTPQK